MSDSDLKFSHQLEKIYNLYRLVVIYEIKSNVIGPVSGKVGFLNMNNSVYSTYAAAESQIVNIY